MGPWMTEVQNAQELVEALRQWFAQQKQELTHRAEELARQKQELTRRTENLMRQEKNLRLQKEAFEIQRQKEEKRLKQQEQLFQMKWKIMEEELARMAKERDKMNRKVEFYRRVHLYEEQEAKPMEQQTIFFCGVTTELALKKRYRELIKIFHPDNLDGDTGVLQQINEEYEQLKKQI